MKACVKSLIFFAVILLICDFAAGQCPDYGTATDQAHKDLNKGKNKSITIPDTWTIQSLPLAHLINSVKKNDENRYLNGAYVYTEGYLISAEEQGPETCNCNKASKAKKSGDVHIYLGLTPVANSNSTTTMFLNVSLKV